MSVLTLPAYDVEPLDIETVPPDPIVLDRMADDSDVCTSCLGDSVIFLPKPGGARTAACTTCDGTGQRRPA